MRHNVCVEQDRRMDDTARISDAFDPELFRAQASRIVDDLADYLARCARREGPVLPWTDPEAMVPQWPADFPERPRDTLRELLARTLDASNHLHHPRYLGHQVTAPLPMAAVCELAMALLNNAMAVYEMGPVGTAMERNLVKWMAGRLGMAPESADGVFTSGGYAGNLTALLAARQTMAGFDAWTDGLHGGPPLAFLVNEQSHYSVRRALQVMGLGEGGAVPVPVDARFRMMPEALPEALARGRAAGRKVVGVCAAACSTATGAFDPLNEIADFCAKNGLWMHVDGAHGASASLSAKYGGLLDGIGRADSVVWDAHKMLLMPALCTAVVFREGRNSFHAFAQHASYLFAGRRPEEEWYNGAVRTLECTKRMMSFPLYAALRVWGTGFFDDYVTRMFDLGRKFGEMARAERDFDLPVAPECNIVCFRWKPPGMEGAALDALQERIRERLIASGAFHLVQTRLPSGLHLRVTIINPLTRESDLAELLRAARAEGMKPSTRGAGPGPAAQR
jgi:L-2,4-diaminobutyrate decarboxylase